MFYDPSNKEGSQIRYVISRVTLLFPLVVLLQVSHDRPTVAKWVRMSIKLEERFVQRVPCDELEIPSRGSDKTPGHSVD